MEQSDNVYSAEQLDYIQELMNIGVGNAATALSQFFNTKAELMLPKVYMEPVPHIINRVGNPDLLVSCVRMHLLGDLNGDLLSIIPETHRKEFTELARKVVLKNNAMSYDMERSLLMETANIIAGVFLTTLNEFGGYNIYHMVPELSIDMLQAILAQPILEIQSRPTAIIVMQKILISDTKFDHSLILVPERNSLKKIVSPKGGMPIIGKNAH